MSRIFRYIVETDGGMAPCPQDELISLGTCKPGIRKSAKIGDWVAGFMPGSQSRGDMVWAGQVAQKLSHEDYRSKFPTRRDAIYDLGPRGNYRSLLAGYHCDPAQRRRDHDNPVLVFDPARSWYFGNEPRSLSDEILHLAAKGRGYRVNFRQGGDEALWEVWLNKRPPGLHGEPRDQVELCRGCLHCSSGSDSDASCGRTSKSRKRKVPRRC